jgi:hypothetical protein
MTPFGGDTKGGKQGVLLNEQAELKELLYAE